MKKIIAIVLIPVFVALIAGCGIFNSNDILQKSAVVSGYVTNSRGGPPLEDARVYGVVDGESLEFFTDEEGYFELEVRANKEISLFVEKENFSRARIQGMFLKKEENFELEIPLRETFYDGWSLVPPEVSVKGIKHGDVISGDLDIKVTVDGENSPLIFYVYFCGQQRSPILFSQQGTREGEIRVDTTQFPNGAGYIRILAYDSNENVTLAIIPVEIKNKSSQPSILLPADLNYLLVASITFGETYGYYSASRQEHFARLNLTADPHVFELQNGGRVNLQGAPAKGTIFNVLQWKEVAGAQGYNVYRSFEEGGFNGQTDGAARDYELIGSIIGTEYQDYSPKLSPGFAVYYKVVPYNDKGEGNGMERFAIPLPPYNVHLQSPANGDTDVSLLPIFRWSIDVDFDDFMAGLGLASYQLESLYDFLIFFAAKPLYWEKELAAEKYFMELPLEAGSVYTWDIGYADTYVVYGTADRTGASQAEAIAGTGLGSINGGFVFTTEHITD